MKVHLKQIPSQGLHLNGKEDCPIQELAPEVMRHRVGLTYEAEAEEVTSDKIIAQVVERTPVPAK